MHSDHRIKQSRAAWKNKAVVRTIDNCGLRKELVRLKAERDHYKKAAKDAEKSLAQLKKEKTRPLIREKVDLVLLALRLFLEARIGFRAVSRVLTLLAQALGIAKAPCPQTIINWLLRLSITRLAHPLPFVPLKIEGDVFSNGQIWLIDTSIGLGSGKILALLAVDAKYYSQDNPQAITLKDVSCLAVAVRDSWTGENIANLLQKVIAVAGRPAAYLKDGGTDLKKAVELLADGDLASLSIDDVSHVVANLFKKEYGEHPQFDTFISACGQASKKLKQTILACLVPPKVTTRARFMNLHRLITWADRILKHSPVGRAENGSLVAKLRNSMDRLPECRLFISRFLRDATPLLECQKILKNHGLGSDTHERCRKILADSLPKNSSIHTGFLDWAAKQRTVAESLGMKDIGLPVSSDPIESLFAVTKQHGVGDIKDANLMARHVPAFCGRLTREDAERVLTVTVAEQQKVFGDIISLTKQRRRVMNNPENLETLNSDKDKGKSLELILMTKTWGINPPNHCGSIDPQKVIDLQQDANGSFQIAPTLTAERKSKIRA